MKILKNTKFPGFKLKGHCKKCGKCCRNITFMIENKYVIEKEEFERMKTFDPKYKHFFISGKDEKGILLFTCKSLGDDNLCGDYFFRSFYCRLYPRIMMKSIKAGAVFPEECGYYVEIL